MAARLGQSEVLLPPKIPLFISYLGPLFLVRISDTYHDYYITEASQTLLSVAAGLCRRQVRALCPGKFVAGVSGGGALGRDKFVQG